MRSLLLAALLLLPVAAWAEGPVVKQSTCVASWTAPTTNADGTPLTDLAAYRLYDGAALTPFVTVPSATAAPAPNTTVTTPCTTWPVGQRHTAVAAVDTAGNESVRSASFPFVLLDDVPPQAPSGLRVGP